MEEQLDPREVFPEGEEEVAEKRIYHGWLFREIDRKGAFKDHWSVQFHEPVNGPLVTRTFGYGEKACVEAIEFFENTRKLGHVMLEETPVGYRVYTKEVRAKSSKKS